MLHLVIELLPFLSGLLCGLLVYLRTADRRLRPQLLASGSLAIGVACALIAGELFGGLPTALFSVAMDSGTAALGWLVAHFSLKRIMA